MAKRKVPNISSLNTENYVTDITQYSIEELIKLKREIWVIHPDIGKDYLFSNFGRVRSFKWNRDKIRVSSTNSCGYKQFSFTLNHRTVNITLHRLILQSFKIPNPERKRTINHKDGDKSNNKLNNLEWATDLENVTHARKNGLTRYVYGNAVGFRKLTEKQAIEIFKSTLPTKKLAKIYKISRVTISHIKCGDTWSKTTGVIKKRKWLDKQTVMNIFNSDGTQILIAKKYKTTRANVYMIKSGKNWSHLTGKNRIKLMKNDARN